ncbi:MAG: UDP-3-O-(3-hydroxymyristoyl)glucosamine N-acyltransferase [Syntrophorhabdaceae bacterium PtaU1.Bin034]|jgi:carbonic anhydrase/acetyltransferase-like protein (isoleucine patch superfamily)|nr:MAG: UDP-3-O-(3-hydroxymyristoyl)glucosamine N-acyltransferase [Syntrophorhabdaceae bacterium PtaU1.Bin034]
MFYRFDGRQPVIGSGTYVSETATVIGDVRIGKGCYIGHGAILRGDYGTIEIGDEVAVEEGVIIHAPPHDRCSIGTGVIIGHGAIIHARLVSDLAAIGMGAILSIRSEVGRESIVAEGAVVKREQKVFESVVVAGNPAKDTRKVSEVDKDYWAYSRKIYTDLARKYCEADMEKVEVS